MERPNFNHINSYDEFSKYYWYRTELATICKMLGLDHTGTKQELNQNIQAYFEGTPVQKQRTRPTITTTKEISLESPLLDCGFSFNKNFREYFSLLTGIADFKFTADMAAAWRKVKQENDHNFTIQDMLNVYEQKSDYAKYDHSVCQWNQFLKDFCADPKNADCHSKLKAASVLWKIIRDSSQPKVYSHELVEANLDLLEAYL